MKHWRLISWASLSLLVGCTSGSSGTKPVAATPKAIDPLVLEWTDPTNEIPAYLSNGDLGVRIARSGAVLVTADGDSSFSSSKEYEPRIKWFVDGIELDPKSGSNYLQSLDLKDGTLVTSWIQHIGTKAIRIESEPKFRYMPFTQWKITSDTNASLTNSGPYSEGETIDLVAGVEYKSLEPAQLVWDDVSPTFNTLPPDYVSLEPESFSILSPPITADFVIDGSLEDEQAIRSMLFYLRSSMRALVPPSGPMGLSNDTYGGHVFWDSDVWMYPALAFVSPYSAKEISQFRLDHIHDAYDHANRTLFPTSLVNWSYDSQPARYPWQSGADGKEKTEGPTAKGDHQSGGVAWSLDMASALGLVEQKDAVSVGTAVANYYKLRLTKNSGQAEIQDVTGVDEWFQGDNDLYTNAIADWTIRKYLGENVNMYYPHDDKGLLAYEGDNRSAYKQAAAPLILWPLEREDLVDDPIAFLDLFEGKEAPNGPAMSLSIYALIRARYGDADQAYETWRESWKRYTDGNPLMLFSEVANQPERSYFLTGAAGCLNSVIYGFIGVRIIDEEPNDEAKIKLENGKWLVIRPNLPAAWNSITFKGMQVLGNSYTVFCEGRTITITLNKK